MRIGYIIQQSPDLRNGSVDGPSGHVLEVIRGLSNQGHQVTLLISLDGKLWRSADLDTFYPVVVPAIDGGLLRLWERAIRRIQSALDLPYLNLFESLRFALACRQELAHTEVLYERQSWMGYGGALASFILGQPLLLEYNGDQLHDLEAKGIAPKGISKWIALKLTALCLRRCSTVIASGEGWRRHFLESWSFPEEQVCVVENGSALLGILEREDLACFRDELESAGPLHLLYLGGFLPWHGVDLILRVFARLASREIQGRLTLIGDGDGRLEAEELAEALGVALHASFTGALTPIEFAPLLAEADIGLSPYCGWKEYSGLKLIDYKAAGLAIIASGEGDQPSTLRDGVSGIIVKPCDEDELLGAVLRLAEDAKLRHRLGQQARKDAEAMHGWDRTARQIEAIIQQVISKVENQGLAA